MLSARGRYEGGEGRPRLARGDARLELGEGVEVGVRGEGVDRLRGGNHCWRVGRGNKSVVEMWKRWVLRR